MSRFNRREFLKTTVAAGTLAGLGPKLPAYAARKSATDLVPLGNTGIQVTRLAFGTGTFGGRVQRELGQEQFTRLVRYAYDQGIRFFETADAYRGMPEMLGNALKGIPRDSYRLMTKYRLRTTDDTKATIDRFRKELQSEYLDILLLHCVRTLDWPDTFARYRDEFSEAKQKKIVRAHGASAHGLLPVRAFPGNKWVDVALFRINHNGTRMDTLQGGDGNERGDVNEVTSQAKKVRAQGSGLLGMKLVGEGQFTNAADRDAAVNHAFNVAGVHAVTIGFKNTAEIDEAIRRINTQLNV